jgi:arylsulfatase
MNLVTRLFFAVWTVTSSGNVPAFGHSTETTSAPRPNIILCMADDLGWGCVGYNGADVIRTPHLDVMSREGIRFDRFYAAAPVCSPTRASCLTGRHPYRTGVFFANTGILRPEEITLAEVLKPHGYATGHFGKWHLGTFTDTEHDANRGGSKHPELVNPPSRHGFDVYFSTESKVPTWDPMQKPRAFKDQESSRFGWNHITHDSAAVPYGTSYWTNKGKVTDNLDGDDSRVIMDRAIPFIQDAAEKSKPFLAVIWFHAPHLPCVAGPRYAAMYKDQDFKMQQYAGCITAIDDQMGRLRAKLKELKINDNTMLFFTSDNGPENGTPGDAGPYRARKRSLYEGGVRVPGLMTWPNRIKHPMVTDIAVVTSDYLPTVIDALEIDPPSNVLDGMSMLPLLDGEALQRPAPIGFMSAGQQAFNDNNFKFYAKGNKTELYAMDTDPHEKNNIAAEHPEIVEAFRKSFTAWQASCKDSFDGGEYGTSSLERVPQKWPKSR